MTEKPMSPHERATRAIGDDFKNLGYTELHARVTAALQAQSNADEARHREKQGTLRTMLAAALTKKDDVENQLAAANQEIHRFVSECGRCGISGEKAEGTAYCPECLAWYREEWGQHSPCAKEAVLQEELDAKNREIAMLTDKLIAAGNAKADAKERVRKLEQIIARAIPMLRHHEDDREVCYESCVACAADAAMEKTDGISGIDSGSVEAESREKIQQIGYAETLRRVGDCGKWSLTWESVSNVLELLQEGIISRRKCHETLNSILHGESTHLPELENTAFDDVELPGETVRQLRRSAFELSNDLDMAQGKLDQALAERDAARAREARLAEALDRVTIALSAFPVKHIRHLATLQEEYDVARAVLKSTDAIAWLERQRREAKMAMAKEAPPDDPPYNAPREVQDAYARGRSETWQWFEARAAELEGGLG